MLRLVIAAISCAICISAHAQQGGPPHTNSRKTIATNFREIWVNDRGAACNGVGDDSAAFQSAINEASAIGVPVKFLGTCAVANNVIVSAPVEMAGGGPPNDQPNGPGSTMQSEILVTNPSVVGLLVTTASAVYLHDFSLVPSGSSPGISINPPIGINTASKLERLNVFGGQKCISFLNTQLFTLVNSQISCSNVTVEVAGTVNPDAGDSTIYGSTLQAGDQGTALLWTGSGGLRFENNKINLNAAGPTGGMAFGVRLDPAPGVRTSDIFIIGNSIEGLSPSVNGYGVFAQRSGTITSVGNVLIHSNEIVARGCIYIPTDANAAWMGNVSIANNACGVQSSGPGTFGISVDGVIGLSIIGNTIAGPSSGTSTAIGSGSQGETTANCVIGMNPHTGAFGPSAPGSCTTIAPF